MVFIDLVMRFGKFFPYAPIICGMLSVIFSSLYVSGLHFGFGLTHKQLDVFGWISFCLCSMGCLLGLLLRWTGDRNRSVVYGIFLSISVFIYTFFWS